MAKSAADIFSDCQKINPEKTPVNLVKDQSAMIMNMLKAVGAESCKTGTAIVVSPFVIGGGNYSQGCEQIAVAAAAFDASQKVFNCAIQQLSQSSSITQSATFEINVDVGPNFQARDCTVEIKQLTGIRIAVYTEFSNDVKVAMQNHLQDTMNTFLKNAQADKQSGLFTTPSGQKSITALTARVQQLSSDQSFTNIISSVFQNFNDRAVINFKLGAGAFFEFTRPTTTAGGDHLCFTINAENVISLLSESIVSNAIDVAFNNDLSNDFKTVIENTQQRETTGLQIPDFGAIIIVVIIIVVVIVGVVLMSVLKKPAPPGGGAAPHPIIAGPAGIGFGSAVFIVGIATIIAGIVLLIQKKKTWGIVLIVVGTLIGGVGLYVLLRALSQQALFKQQMQLARINAGKGRKVPEVIGGERVS